MSYQNLRPMLHTVCKKITRNSSSFSTLAINLRLYSIRAQLQTQDTNNNFPALITFLDISDYLFHDKRRLKDSSSHFLIIVFQKYKILLLAVHEGS